MSVATRNAPTVRIFAPDGNGAYIQWENLTDSGKQQAQERVYSSVRRAMEFKQAAIAHKEYCAALSKQVQELIDKLTEDT